MRDNPVSAIVILPPSYNHSYPNRTYSVLFALHGAGDIPKTWSRLGIHRYAESLDLIVVCPDGGRTSWYFDSPLDSEYQYETFMTEELVPFVDANYRTIPSASRRAILGFSMGGHGALFLAMRHPGVFGMAVSMSGGVDIRPFPKQWDIALRIGTMEEYPERWENLTVINQARERLGGSDTMDLAISLDCGSEDAFFLGVNRALHQLLLKMKVRHDYSERPGGHNLEYLRRSLRLNMVFVGEQQVM